MSDYKLQADRMKVLGRQGQGSPNLLQLPSREPVQAEVHRPPLYVQTLIQRHFFPAEGAVAEGVGEPVGVNAAELRCADQLALTKYQSLVRRRAAETSKAIKAEQIAKIRLVVSARERLQAAKAFCARVAAVNSKASPHNASQGKERSPRETLDGKLHVQFQDEENRSHGGLEDRAYLAGPLAHETDELRSADAKAWAEAKPSKPSAAAAPARSLQAYGQRGSNTVAEPPLERQQPVTEQPVLRASASMTARQRLAAHSSAHGPEPAGSKAPEPPLCAASQWASNAAGSHAKAFKARVLQPANTIPTPSGAKMWKGKPLPLAVSMDDETGLARIAQKVSERRLKLQFPRLCACPKSLDPTSVFSRSYVGLCARNCPLYMQTKRYESLLTAWLREKDII